MLAPTDLAAPPAPFLESSYYSRPWDGAAPLPQPCPLLRQHTAKFPGSSGLRHRPFRWPDKLQLRVHLVVLQYLREGFLDLPKNISGLRRDGTGYSSLPQGPKRGQAPGLMALLQVKRAEGRGQTGPRGGLKPSTPDKVIKGHEGVLPCAPPLPEPQPPSMLSSRSRALCRSCQHGSWENCCLWPRKKRPTAWPHVPATALKVSQL